jgi:peptide subunit release factor 1 (eRF1)
MSDVTLPTPTTEAPAGAATPVESTEVVTSIDEPLERLLAFEPTTFPVLSLYLDLRADDTGRDRFWQFVRRELSGRARTFASGSAEAQSFEKDRERIEKYLEESVQASANGLALFACFAADLWETVQLSAPVEENRLYVYNQPHLYHLTRISDEYPRYAALLTDANSARIFVFGLGETLDTEQVKGKKVQRVKVGGWSQARYQRRVQNAHASHAKEVVDRLQQIVTNEAIQHVVIAGDVQITTLLQQEMPKELQDKLVDVLKIDLKASDSEIFAKTLEAMKRADAETDAQKVDRLLQEARRGGLACTGVQDTLEALTNGQVDEILISTGLEVEHPEEEPVDAILAPEIPDPQGETETEEPRPALVADLLVTKAKQTDATVTFIQDTSLLQSVEGVGGFLRWRV